MDPAVLFDQSHLVIGGGLLALGLLVAALLVRRQDRVVRGATSGLALLVEHAADPIVIVGTVGDIRYVNPAARRVFGFGPDETPGSVLGMIHTSDLEDVAARMAAAVAGDPLSGVIERRVRAADGRWLICESVSTNLLHHPGIEGLVVTLRDVTDRRAAEAAAAAEHALTEAVLAHEATHDGLTGVFNRAGLLNALDHLLRDAPRRPLSVLFLDLDDFKAINDSHGHQVGDEVLRVVAERIVQEVRGYDVVGRLGGDEFVVLCPGLSIELAGSTAARIGAALDAPIVVDGQELRCGVSAGVVTASDGDAESLLTAADAAMYEVKRARRERRNRPTPKEDGGDPDEARRLDLLRRLGLFATEGLSDPYVDTIVKLAAEVCGVPIAAVSLIDTDRQFFKASVGLDVTETPRSQSLCAHSILRPGETTVVPDAALDGRFRDNPLVGGDQGIRYYAGAPITIDGTAIGALCVIDSERRDLSDHQLTALERLRDSLVTYLELTAPEAVRLSSR